MTKKPLVILLNELLLENDTEEIVRYFAFEFWDDYPNEDKEILDFLNDSFYDIDMMRADGKDVTEIVCETLRITIDMLNGKK